MGLSGIGGTLVLGDGRTAQEGVHPPLSGCHQSSSSFIHFFHIYLVPDPGQVQGPRQINQIPTLKAQIPTLKSLPVYTATDKT